MQREVKKTKITVREDYPTAIASEAYGANVGCLAFNIDFIMLRNPKIGIDLLRIFEKCKELKDIPVLDPTNPLFEKALSNLKGILNADSN